jgi:hypothetical protein
MRGVVVDEPRSGSVDGFGSTETEDDLSDKAVGHRKVLAPQQYLQLRLNVEDPPTEACRSVKVVGTRVVWWEMSIGMGATCRDYLLESRVAPSWGERVLVAPWLAPGPQVRRRRF